VPLSYDTGSFFVSALAGELTSAEIPYTVLPRPEPRKAWSDRATLVQSSDLGDTGGSRDLGSVGRAVCHRRKRLGAARLRLELASDIVG
jgi:hypothetical protein